MKQFGDVWVRVQVCKCLAVVRTSPPRRVKALLLAKRTPWEQRAVCTRKNVHISCVLAETRLSSSSVLITPLLQLVYSWCNCLSDAKREKNCFFALNWKFLTFFKIFKNILLFETLIHYKNLRSLKSVQSFSSYSATNIHIGRCTA